MCYRDPELSKYQGDYKYGTWPDELVVDYVHAWQEDPSGRAAPTVKLAMADPVQTLDADRPPLL